MNGERKPIAYIRRSLTSMEQRYSQIEREALGCAWAVECLHNYLFGIKFTLLTHNKPLPSMFDPYSSKVSYPAFSLEVTSVQFSYSAYCRECQHSRFAVAIAI